MVTMIIACFVWATVAFGTMQALEWQFGAPQSIEAAMFVAFISLMMGWMAAMAVGSRMRRWEYGY
ncbi:hypothetical protein [Natrinema sp. DC36]|uniref:hypothetical protein n=1 Tax=Natrinema sp. DC36 TaxID=2878680 RepID=UPI001CF0D024|nr:hypothetical protein [Natrinema sp. DC36]